MLKFMLSDLRFHIRLWLPAFVSAVLGAACAGGVIIAVSSGLHTAEPAPVNDALEGVRVLGGTVSLLTLTATSGVVGSTAGFILTSQAPNHARLLFIGFTPKQLKRMLRAEIACLVLFAAAAAIPLSYAAATVILWQWAAIGIVASGQLPVAAYWHPYAILLLVVLAAVWGTWGPTRRASKIPAATALREASTHKPHIAWVRSGLAVMLFVGGTAILLAVSLLPLGGSDDRAAGALSGLLLLIVATLLVPLWTIRPLLWGWTALVFSQSAPWFLAREACRFAASRTLATVVPFAIASSLLAVLYGGGAISGGGTSLTEIGVLLGPTIVVAWGGGICIIALIGQSRARERRLLIAAGASRKLLLQTVCLEGIIYAITALLYGALFLSATILVLSSVSDISLSSALHELPWSAFLVISLATIGLAIGTALISIHQPVQNARDEKPRSTNTQGEYS
ncbi:FtsX-like permease family protein [Brevibacterium sp. FAM 24638]|uniref:FtsX-like permease family protein n=1 Tax=Brevibacterium sp. FAM 24638 TaxID=3415681 RepID=UPI003C7AD576